MAASGPQSSKPSSPASCSRPTEFPDAAVAKAIDNGLHAFGDMLSALSR